VSLRRVLSRGISVTCPSGHREDRAVTARGGGVEKKGIGVLKKGKRGCPEREGIYFKGRGGRGSYRRKGGKTRTICKLVWGTDGLMGMRIRERNPLLTVEEK